MRTIIFVILITSASVIWAQGYKTAIGLRLGSEFGLTGQQYIGKHGTLEGIFHSSLRAQESELTLLLEKHIPLFTKNFNIYAGAGLHKGWYANHTETKTFSDPAGVSFVGGIELTLGRFNLAWDIKPKINLIGGNQVFGLNTGISIRYVLIKNPILKINQRKYEKRL